MIHEEAYFALMTRAWIRRARMVQASEHDLLLFEIMLALDYMTLRAIMMLEFRCALSNILNEVIHCWLRFSSVVAAVLLPQFIYQAFVPPADRWLSLPGWIALTLLVNSLVCVSICEWWRTCWHHKLIGD